VSAPFDRPDRTDATNPPEAFAGPSHGEAPPYRYPSVPGYSPAPGYPQSFGYPSVSGYSPAPGYPSYPRPPLNPALWAYRPFRFDEVERRPSTATAAAVLGYVTAGFLIIAAIGLFAYAGDINDFNDTFETYAVDIGGELAALGALNLVLAVMILVGGIMLTRGRQVGRHLLETGMSACLLTSLYWVVRWHLGILVVYAVLFAALAGTALGLALARGITEWLRARQRPAERATR